jgi:hypothetical protein
MDALVLYLEEQIQKNEQDSKVLARAMNQLMERREQDRINLERMRGALDKFHADHTTLQQALTKRLGDLAPSPEAVVVEAPSEVSS